MANLLEQIAGYFLTKKGEKELDVVDNKVSFAPLTSTDGGDIVDAGGYNSQFSNFDPSTENEQMLISQYRETARCPEVGEAIDEIVNEMVSEDNEGNIIQVELKDVETSEGIKEKIRDEFEAVLDLLEFEQKGTDLVRRWYVDGRLAFHKVVDKNKPRDGILELRYINPTSIKKITEVSKKKEDGIEVNQVVKEYFTYNPSAKSPLISIAGNSQPAQRPTSWNYASPVLSGMKQPIMVSPDAIAYITSGIIDEEYNSVLSFLHPVVKIVNQLKSLEDSLVIYRISRAPERRIFYVDVGNLPKAKAEQYLKSLMDKFKNTLNYDPLTGKIGDSRRHMSVMEDYWIPRRENGKATEITTLPGGQNLGELTDVNYFLTKLYKSLKVPSSRFITDQPLVAGMGRTSEITRDEIRFQKFIEKLRKKFNLLFLDILGTQCQLKNIVSKDDWNEFKKNVVFNWSRDNFFFEMKEQDILKERLSTLAQADPYVGKYFTQEYVFRNILKVSDEEYDELLTKLADEKAENDKNQAADDQSQFDRELANKEQEMKVVQKFTPDEVPRLPASKPNPKAEE